MSAISGSNSADYNPLYEKYPELASKIDARLARFQMQSRDEGKKLFLQSRFMLGNDNAKGAAELFNTRADLLEEKDPGKAAVYREYAKGLETAPLDKSIDNLDMMGARLLGDDYLKPIAERAKVGKTVAEAAKIGAEAADIPLERKQKDDETLLNLTEKKIALRAKQRALDAMEPEVREARTKSLDGLRESTFKIKQIDDLLSSIPDAYSGGAFNVAVNNLTKWLGIVEDADKQVFLQKFRGFSIDEAMKRKAAGALSEGEFNKYLSAVPTDQDSDAVIANYVNSSLKVIRSNYAYDRLRTKFLEKNKDEGSAKAGHKLVDKAPPMKKGELFEEYIARLGSKLPNYAPTREQLGGLPSKAPEPEQPAAPSEGKPAWAGQTPGYFGKY